MGKKRAISVRRIAEKLYEKYPDKFVDDFEENKKLISEIIDIPTKTLRNEVAGYIQSIKMKKMIVLRPSVPTDSENSGDSRRRRGRRRR
ncbi:30S ribosomal protein S17e [Candidatus Bathyarchaeota archaeon]|nr:30S ribosomal protein S17e [Candidatus Bathyarchaeota archaeon]